jgi:hypothetical protein
MRRGCWTCRLVYPRDRGNADANVCRYVGDRLTRPEAEVAFAEHSVQGDHRSTRVAAVEESYKGSTKVSSTTLGPCWM